MDSIKQLLETYLETNEESIRNELISYILTEELKITTVFSDIDLMPNDGDEYQEMRELLNEIRMKLKLI